MGQEPETVEKNDQAVQEAIRSGEVNEETENSEEETSLNEEIEGDDRNVMAVDTAFVVFVQDGSGFGVANLGDVSIKLEDKDVYLEPMRRATPDDMYRYCSEVSKDIQVSSTAQLVMAQFIEYTRQMQEQARLQGMTDRVMRGPNGPKGPQGGGGLQVPGR